MAEKWECMKFTFFSAVVVLGEREEEKERKREREREVLKSRSKTTTGSPDDPRQNVTNFTPVTFHWLLRGAWFYVFAIKTSCSVTVKVEPLQSSCPLAVDHSYDSSSIAVIPEGSVDGLLPLTDADYRPKPRPQPTLKRSGLGFLEEFDWHHWI